MQLIEYIFSTVNVVLSNPCVGPSPRIKISFFLFSTCTEELKSTPKMTVMSPNPPLRCKKAPFPSNPIPLLISAFLVILMH